jgi:hypothetical protein
MRFRSFVTMDHRHRASIALMNSHRHSPPLLQSALEVVRRPFVGSLLFGCIVGGIPLAILFNHLAFGGVVSSELCDALELFPVGMLATTVGALLGRNVTWEHLLQRTFFTSLGSWIPLPATVYAFLAWRSRYEIFAPQNFPAFILTLVLFATILTPPCWLLALGYAFLKNRNLHAGRSDASKL